MYIHILYIHINIYIYRERFVWPRPFAVPLTSMSSMSRPKADTYAAILSVCEAASSWVSASEAEAAEAVDAPDLGQTTGYYGNMGFNGV